jgi:hypothetical protein
MLITIEKLAKRELVKQQWANFIAIWSSSAVRELGDIFHYNFKVGFQAHPLGYIGVNLDEITQVQKQAQQRNLARMQAIREFASL